MAVAFDNLTLSQRVYEHLRDEILADHLLPGTELSEVALSKELAISRGPIREAMGRLAAEGLITMRPRRRAEVRSLTPQELIDAYQVREALEVMAVRLLIRRVTEADLARLEELIDQMAAHGAEGAVREFFTANVSFHELLCELSGNPKLQEVHHRLEGEIGRFQNRTLALRGSMHDQEVAGKPQALDYLELPGDLGVRAWHPFGPLSPVAARSLAGDQLAQPGDLGVPGRDREVGQPGSDHPEVERALAAQLDGALEDARVPGEPGFHLLA